jgi:hypothetical protein
MAEDRLTTYRISEAARELGISAEWLRVGRGGVTFLLLSATTTAAATIRKKTSSASAKRDVGEAARAGAPWSVKRPA